MRGFFDCERLAMMRADYAPQSIAREHLLAEKYLLAREGQFSVFFGPLGAWPRSATRLIIVGLTPGFAQLREAAELFLKSSPAVRFDEALYSEELRRKVAFHGAMRANLCKMLDVIGVAGKLGFTSSRDLFSEEGTGLVATTSALVFPVFVRDDFKNFSGSRDLSIHALFREMLTQLLLPRLQRAPKARIIPLGVSATSGIDYLIRSKQLDESRVLRNFPHPSGGNGRRKRLFERNRQGLAAAVAAWEAVCVVG